VTFALNDETAFISGVYSDGTLPFYAYAAWNFDNPATYGGGFTNSMKWGAPTAGTPGGTILYYFSPGSQWSGTEQTFLSAGLALWSAYANITFAPTVNVGQAQIIFTRGNDGSAFTSPQYFDSGNAGRTGGNVLLTLTQATISIDTSVAGFGPIDGQFTTYGGYPIMTLLHEEGHSVGLGHAGPYNGDVIESTQQFSAYDSRLWSIMSYIEPTTSSAKFFNQYSVVGTNWRGSDPTGLMLLDILAVQALYGLPTSTPFSGGQTFGFNCNIAGPTAMFFDFSQNTDPILAIWDSGTNNTLDLSGFSSNSSVNLNPGTFSSCNGMTNNIAIAFGTAINRIVLGPGNDSANANNFGDTLVGGAGSDTLIGGTGNDTLSGGSGNDSLNGYAGIDTATFSGSRSIYTIARSGQTTTISGPDGVDTLTLIERAQFDDGTISIGVSVVSDFGGNGTSDILWRNANGAVLLWQMNGRSIASQNTVAVVGSSWNIVGNGDFNGDGDADILWRNTDGSVLLWQMNGSQIASEGSLGKVGLSWSIARIGDFNGDGTSDILWRNTDGSLLLWEMNNKTIASEVGLGVIGSAWNIVGTGDFNGDGITDILWRHTDGSLLDWGMNSTGKIGSERGLGTIGTAWNIVGTGDFGGDGTGDILWRNTDGSLIMWTMTGSTIFSEAGLGTIGAAWSVSATGDYDGDGKADILWRNTDGTVLEWQMNGGIIASEGLVGSLGSSWSIQSASPSGVTSSQAPIAQNSSLNSDPAPVQVSSPPSISDPSLPQTPVTGQFLAQPLNSAAPFHDVLGAAIARMEAGRAVSSLTNGDLVALKYLHSATPIIFAIVA